MGPGKRRSRCSDGFGNVVEPRGIRVFAARIRRPSPFGLGREMPTGHFAPRGFDPPGMGPEMKRSRCSDGFGKRGGA